MRNTSRGSRFRAEASPSPKKSDTKRRIKIKIAKAEAFAVAAKWRPEDRGATNNSVSSRTQKSDRRRHPGGLEHEGEAVRRPAALPCVSAGSQSGPGGPEAEAQNPSAADLKERSEGRCDLSSPEWLRMRPSQTEQRPR